MATDHQYVEVPCQRDVSGAQFSAGIQDYVFSLGRPNVWYPSKSYMRFNLTVTGVGAAAPRVESQIALAEGCISNMYNNATFMAGGQAISQIVSFFPQASAVEYRTANSGAWLDKIGAYTSSYNGDRSSRIANLSKAAVLTAPATYATNAAKVGVSLNEGKEEIYRPTDGKTPDAATVALTAATGVIAGVGTAFVAGDVGSDLHINGTVYRVIAVASATAMTVGQVAPGNVAATECWFMTRRNFSYSQQARNNITVLWKPSALGIFRYDGCLGSGDYRLQLNPDPNYQYTAIEYPYGTATGYGPLTVASAVYALSIVDVKLYIAIAKMSIPDSIQELHLTEFAVQSKNMTSASQNFQWTVPSSTRALYMFLQDTTSGSNPIIPPSVFRVYGTTAVAGTLPTGTGCEQNLTTIQVTYANITKPQTRWVSSFTSGNDYLVQLYMQSLIETHRDSDVGGAENMDQWLQRGPLYCWQFERDSEDRSTEVQTQVTYTMAGGQAWPPSGCNLFLCAEYSRASEITSANGLITNVRALNI